MRFFECSVIFLAYLATCTNLIADVGYVTNFASNTVSVIDTTMQAVETTIPVGQGPFGVAISTNQAFVYVANNTDNTVSVIDTLSNTVVATIPVGLQPTGVAVSPTGAIVYVTNRVSDTVSIIDTATNTVVGTIPLPGGASPIGVVFNPNGLTAYVANSGIDGVSEINVSTSSVTTTLTITGNFGFHSPRSIAISPSGNEVWVGLNGLAVGNIAVLTTSPFAQTTLVAIGGSDVEGIGFLPNGLFAYGSDTIFGRITQINTSTKTGGFVIIVGTSSWGIASTSDGSLVYVANAGSGTVSAVDTATNSVVATIIVGSQPQYIAFGIILPPNNLTGKQKKEDFGCIYQIFNQLRWTASSTPTAVGYQIFRNGVLIATVGPDTFKYSDNNIAKGSTNVYKVVAINSNGAQSMAATLTIGPEGD